MGLRWTPEEYEKWQKAKAATYVTPKEEYETYQTARESTKPRGLDAPKTKRAKYKNRKTVVDGIKFDSMAEATYYSKLKLWKLAGEVLWFCFQPVFDCGGGVKYRADFIVVWKDGRTAVIDVKGFATQEFKNKAKQVEAIHGVMVEEVKT